LRLQINKLDRDNEKEEWKYFVVFPYQYEVIRLPLCWACS